MAEKPYNPSSLTVMVVDDHDPIRKAIIRILSSMGFTSTKECFDGEDAIKLLLKEPIDLIICDLRMRNVGGFEVLKHVRNRHIGNDIPFIVITGEADKDEIVKVADLGADDYVLKPFQAADLEKKVTQVLAKYYSPTELLNTLRLAERHFLSRNYKKAYQTFDQAYNLDRSSLRATYGRAISLAKLGQDQEALEILESITKYNQSFYKNYAAMADIYLASGRKRQAIKAMKHELEINPRQPGRQITLGKLLLKEGDCLGAMEHYRAALQEYPNAKPALMGMAHAFMKSENLDKALYYLKRVRRYHPTTTKALETAVKFAIDNQEVKKGELFLKDEKNSRPDQADAYMVLAKLYMHQDKVDEAINTLNEFLARKEEHIAARKMKAFILLGQKKYQEALEIFKGLLKVAPESDSLIGQAECQSAVGELDAAIVSLHDALRLNPGNGYTFFLLGEIYLKTDQFAKSFASYRRAASLGIDKDKCSAEAMIALRGIISRRPQPLAS